MKIEFERRFGLPRNIVWKYLKDESVLKRAIPGCKSFVTKSLGIYQTELELTIGPIQELFGLEICLAAEKMNSFYQLQVKGNGNVGEINGEAVLEIKEIQGGSMIYCQADADVTGALALAGQRLLEAGAIKGLDAFFQKIEKEIKRKIYLKKKGKQ